MKLVVPVIAGLALAGAAAAQTAPEPAPDPLDHIQQVGGWTVQDVGARPGDDSDRQVSLRRTVEGVAFVLYRTAGDGAGLVMKFSRCEGLNLNSGFSLEGAIPARAAQIRAEIHEAFQDFSKACPPKAGEEAALVEGLHEADLVIETWMRDRPFTYPPEKPSPPRAPPA